MTLSDYRRAVDQGQSVAYFSKVVSASEYYPPVGGHGPVFGMLLTEGNYSSGNYRFGFNGKEMDNDFYGEGNIYDYGFRIYNPRIAKFLSVDPLTASYPWYTPYQFAGNKPIWAIDLDGLEEFIVVRWYTKEGKYINSTMYKIQNKNDTYFGSKGIIYFNLPKNQKTSLVDFRFKCLSKVRPSDVVTFTEMMENQQEYGLTEGVWFMRDAPSVNLSENILLKEIESDLNQALRLGELKGLSKELKAAEYFIQFKHNESNLNLVDYSDNSSQLDKLVGNLKVNPDAVVELHGNASMEGSEEDNMELSEDRVNTIRNYLIEHGIDAERIKTYYHGDKKLDQLKKIKMTQRKKALTETYRPKLFILNKLNNYFLIKRKYLLLVLLLGTSINVLHSQNNFNTHTIEGYSLAVDSMRNTIRYLYTSPDSTIYHVIYYYKDGQKASECTYLADRLNGFYREWYKNGQIKNNEYFILGSRINLFSWYENGNIEMSGQYWIDLSSDTLVVRDMKIDSIIGVNEYGAEYIIIEGTDDVSKKHGKWEFYNKDGSLEKVETWDKGKLVRREEW